MHTNIPPVPPVLPGLVRPASPEEAKAEIRELTDQIHRAENWIRMMRDRIVTLSLDFGLRRVWIESVPEVWATDDRIRLIKLYRELTRCGLPEAVAAIRSVPVALPVGMSLDHTLIQEMGRIPGVKIGTRE